LPILPTEIGLSLQAVSWATRARDRIAVVNGQVLRQGDDIEGYTVRDIDSDAVVLCRSGECHRLAFAFGR
jgi:type II secretory pathway component PulC